MRPPPSELLALFLVKFDYISEILLFSYITNAPPN
jgi:hypothetical protein